MEEEEEEEEEEDEEEEEEEDDDEKEKEREPTMFIDNGDVRRGPWLAILRWVQQTGCAGVNIETSKHRNIERERERERERESFIRNHSP